MSTVYIIPVPEKSENRLFVCAKNPEVFLLQYMGQINISLCKSNNLKGNREKP